MQVAYICGLLLSHWLYTYVHMYYSNIATFILAVHLIFVIYVLSLDISYTYFLLLLQSITEMNRNHKASTDITLYQLM